jgi:hypothetical protein
MENMENKTPGSVDNKKNNNTIWWVIVVIVLILIIGFAVKKHNADYASTDQQQAVTPSAIEPTEDISAGSIHATSVTGGSAVTIAYADALVKYANTRIQLDMPDIKGSACTATPSSVTYKNGTTIMIDNRTPNVVTVKVGVPYTVKGYGFKLINLSSSTLPATWLIDCGSQQNVATILIQK